MSDIKPSFLRLIIIVSRKVQIPKLENTNYIEKKTLINERDFIPMVLVIFAKMDGQPSSTNSFLILKKTMKKSFR